MQKIMLDRRRKDVGAKVLERLMTAEIDADTALSSTAELMSLLPAARKDARISAGEIQAALVRITASWDALVVARGEMIESHRALAEAGERFGVIERGYGGLFEKAEEKQLTVVAQAA